MNKKNPYETLNVPKDATEAEIKKAYRDKAKKEHPDVGGDTEKFKETTHAYSLISSPEKRDYYDKHGEEMPQENTDSRANKLIHQLIDAILAECTPEQILKLDIVKRIVGSINDNLSKLRQEISNQKTMAERLQKLSDIFDKKLTHKKSKTQINFFKASVDEKKKFININLAELDNQNKILDKALELMTDFSFDYDKDLEEQLNRQRSVYTGTSTGTGTSFFGF